MSTVNHYAKILDNNPQLLESLYPRLTDYIPHEPTAKQLAFLMLPHKEAFFGGAAGGGKSDALLMAALQYVDVPGYAAILFRRTKTDLELPNSLLDRAHDWLDGTDAKWIPAKFHFRFPSGAILQFAYIGEANASSRYQGIEVQFCGFDEVCQHWEEDYTYLFSRLRKLACPKHKLDEQGKPIYVDGCPLCDIRKLVPLRMRAASNPPRAGDRGSTGWVKDRFRIELQPDGMYRGTHPNRPHIPSFLEDNPYIDQHSYDEGLQELDPVTREQLRRGDWGVSADGRFRKSWARYYVVAHDGKDIVLDYHGNGPSFPINKCRCFVTCDPAASQKEGPGDKHIWRKAPSHTVIATWLLTPKWDLILWDLVRFQKEIPDIFPALANVYREHKPEFLAIEANGLNIGVYQVAKRLGLPVRPLLPKGDKVVRSTDVAVRMEQGKVYLPVESNLIEIVDNDGRRRKKPWREVVEQELFTWTGHPQEPADIIDNFSYAGLMVSDEASRHEKGIRAFSSPIAVG